MIAQEPQTEGHPSTGTGDGSFVIEPFTPRDEADLINLLRRNLEPFEEAGSVLAATYRRLAALRACYTAEGTVLLVVRELASGQCAGCVGLGPLAGLPYSEGIGEIRDLVIDERFRRRGLARRLLAMIFAEARRLAYRRLYLETTPEMEKAQALFRSFGFRPVLDQRKKGRELCETLPCYFMLDQLPTEDQKAN